MNRLHHQPAADDWQVASRRYTESRPRIGQGNPYSGCGRRADVAVGPSTHGWARRVVGCVVDCIERLELAT